MGLLTGAFCRLGRPARCIWWVWVGASREGREGRAAAGSPSRRPPSRVPRARSTGLRFRFGDTHGRRHGRTQRGTAHGKERGFLRRVRVGLDSSRRCESNQPEPDPSVPTKHPFTPATGIPISDPPQPQSQARPPLRPPGARQPASEPLWSPCRYLIFAAPTKSEGGGKKERGKTQDSHREVRGQLAWCGWFRARASAIRSLPIPIRPAAAAPPPGLPPTVPPARHGWFHGGPRHQRHAHRPGLG